MLWLALGLVALFVLFGGLRAFERADVRTIKSFLVWTVALGGLVLTVLLFLTGRGGIALAGLTLFGPLIWEKWRAGQRPSVRGGTSGQQPGRRDGGMSRAEAYQVLGLPPGAREVEIREAYKRLMRGAHPDNGGSDWLAARINQARDVLLGGRR